MAVTALYQGKTVERNTNGITTTETYSGSKTDCETWANGKTIGATYTGLGRLESISISQYSGSIYTVTAKYQNANGTSAGGSSVTPPDYAFGQYSASMDGSMISTPLEIHKNASGQYDYLSNWNHFLIAKYPVGGTVPTTPAWWSTLGADSTTGEISPIPAADQTTYQWSENGSLPVEDGYVWIVLENPTMPGYQCYDRALFTQTESIRFKSYLAACNAVSSKLNKIGTPTYNNYGSYFQANKWKCDRATIQWTGEYWLATLTWTYSPDGWNTTLYQTIS